MDWTFNPVVGLIVVESRVHGPNGSVFARLVLDTGADRSVLTPALLEMVGIGPGDAVGLTTISTMNGNVEVPTFRVASLFALGREVDGFVVHGAEVPFGEAINGLLGLDFFRGHRLAIDFREGTIEVE